MRMVVEMRSMMDIICCFFMGYHTIDIFLWVFNVFVDFHRNEWEVTDGTD